MTVQELFAMVNRDELADKLRAFYDKELAEEMLDEFEDSEAYGKGDVLTDYDYITNTILGSGGPVSLAEWNVTLGVEIDNSLFEKMTETELAAKIFLEMTENGITEEEQRSEITRLLDGASLAI